MIRASSKIRKRFVAIFPGNALNIQSDYLWYYLCINTIVLNGVRMRFTSPLRTVQTGVASEFRKLFGGVNHL